MDFERYQAVPDDWYVLVADVEGSTKAVGAGRYKEVNLIGVSAIAAMVNAVKPMQIPFVFGGDGASFCIPDQCLASAKLALTAVAAMARDSFGIHLRIGAVPVSVISGADRRVLVARHQVSSTYIQAMFAGGGLQYAEDLVKDPEVGKNYRISGHPEGAPDCEGLECRWKEIPSPSDETVAVLIQAINGDDLRNALIYKDAYTAIGSSYGSDERHHPVMESKMVLTLDRRALAGETAIRTYAQSIAKRIHYAISLYIKVILGHILLATGGSMAGTDYRKYKREVVANTDRQKFDDTLRLVLAGTKSQRESLEKWLNEQFEKGDLVYGLHVAKSSLMTCLIGNRETGDHLHFVDASGGGYAMAAVDLKRRLAEIRMKG